MVFGEEYGNAMTLCARKEVFMLWPGNSNSWEGRLNASTAGGRGLSRDKSPTNVINYTLI